MSEILDGSNPMMKWLSGERIPKVELIIHEEGGGKKSYTLTNVRMTSFRSHRNDVFGKTEITVDLDLPDDKPV